MLKESLLKFMEYSRIERGLSPWTLQSYHFSFKMFFHFLKDEDINLEMINRDMIRQFFYYGKNERKWSNKSYCNYFDNFNVFFKFLVSEEILLKNPMDGMQKPKTKEVILKPLSQEEIQKILYSSFSCHSYSDFVKFRNYCMFYFALHSGLRLSEILKLTDFDIDFKQEVLHVRDGKGGKDREVVLTSEIVSTLKKYLLEREKAGLLIPSGIFFCSKTGKPLLIREFHRLVEKIKKLSGVDFSAHDFRRTYATTLSKRGVPPFMIQQQLGHSNIQTTMRYVVHNLEERKDAIRKLVLY